MKDALYASFVEENNSAASLELQQLFHVGDNFLAYALAQAGSGTNAQEAIEVGSQSTVEALEELEKIGHIKKVNNKYKAKQNLSSPSFKTLKKLASILIGHYKPKHIGQQRNFIDVTTTGLSREGIKVLQEQHRKHYDEVLDIRLKYAGEIKVFSLSAMDTFTSKDIDKPKQTNKLSRSIMSILSIFTLGILSLNYNNVQAFNNDSFFTSDNEVFKKEEIKNIKYFTNTSYQNGYMKRHYHEIEHVILKNGKILQHNDILINSLKKIGPITDKFDPGKIKVVDPGGTTGGGG